MSFLTATEETMVFELWPTPMRKQVRRLKGDHDFEPWDIFPATLSEMATWADVYKDPARKDTSRNHILIYKSVPNTKADTVFPVAIRLQGILGRFRVDRFGNWSGNEGDVARAVQYVTMSSGGHQAAWDATINSINLACDYVSRRLHLPMQAMSNKKDIYLQKRAFVKRDQPYKIKEPLLTDDEDPGRKYMRIQDLWSVMRPLRTADLTDTGKILAMDAVLLTEGDFVDVGAELDFVVNRDRHKGTTLKCFLSCDHIVRLMPASLVRDMQLDNKQPKRKRATTPLPEERAVKKFHTTLLLDNE